MTPQTSVSTTSISGKFKSISVVRLQHRQEGFLGNFYVAHLLHALFAGFLLFEEFFLAGHIAAVALGDHILAQCLDRGAGDHMAANRLEEHTSELQSRENLVSR